MPIADTQINGNRGSFPIRLYGLQLRSNCQVVRYLYTGATYQPECDRSTTGARPELSRSPDSSIPCLFTTIRKWAFHGLFIFRPYYPSFGVRFENCLTFFSSFRLVREEGMCDMFFGFRLCLELILTRCSMFVACKRKCTTES